MGERMASLTLLFLEIIMPTPKPELWAETNYPLAPWKNLTLWCRSPSGSTKEFVLLKDGTGWIATRPATEQVRAAFPLGALTQSHTGSYHCHSWEEMAVSEPSEALELVGTGKKGQKDTPGNDPSASWTPIYFGWVRESIATQSTKGYVACQSRRSGRSTVIGVGWGSEEGAKGKSQRLIQEDFCCNCYDCCYFCLSDKVTPGIPSGAPNFRLLFHPILFSRYPPQACHFCFSPSPRKGTENPVQRMAGRHGVCAL